MHIFVLVIEACTLFALLFGNAAFVVLVFIFGLSYADCMYFQYM